MSENEPKLVSGDGGHYSIYKETTNGMELLQSLFPDGNADQMNICLFSTSGIHGSYQTIEDEEEKIQDEKVGITFLVIKPRLVMVIYGIVYPQSKKDYAFLKKIRHTSHDRVYDIG